MVWQFDFCTTFPEDFATTYQQGSNKQSIIIDALKLYLREGMKRQKRRHFLHV